MDDAKFLVFVYGTLKSGQRNHHYMQKAPHEFIGIGVSVEARYRLCEFKSWSSPGRRTPALYIAKADELGTKIIGEVYEVGAEGLAHLDELEQVGIHYNRENIDIICNEKPMSVYVYFKIGDEDNSADPKFISHDKTLDAYEWAETK